MRGPYTCIYREIWSEDRFLALSDLGRMVYFYVLTTPLGNGLGCFRAGISAMAEDMGLPQKAFAKAFREGSDEAFGDPLYLYDETHKVVFIPKYLNRNPSNNPNVLKSLGKEYIKIPDSPLKEQCFNMVKAFAEGLGEAFAKAFAEAFPKAPGTYCPSPRPCPSPSPRPDSSKEESNTPHTPRKQGRVPQYTEDFLRFWEAYPWKSGKGPAMKAWHEDKWHRPPIEAVLASIEAHKAGWDWTKDGGKYIPLPATWLNKPGWEDVPRAAPVEESRREREERLEREETARWNARTAERYDENGHRRQEVDHGTD